MTTTKHLRRADATWTCTCHTVTYRDGTPAYRVLCPEHANHDDDDERRYFASIGL